MNQDQHAHQHDGSCCGGAGTQKRQGSSIHGSTSQQQQQQNSAPLMFPSWKNWKSLYLMSRIIMYLTLISLVKPVFNFFTLQYEPSSMLLWCLMQGILPFGVFIFAFLTITSIPNVKDYVKHFSKFNTTSQQYPPPAVWTSHYAIGLAVFVLLDTIAIPAYHYQTFVTLYPSYVESEVVEESFAAVTGEVLSNNNSPLTALADNWKPLLVFCTASIFQFFLGIIFISVLLLVLNNIQMICKAQRWWNTYIHRYQTKFRCFVVGSFSQSNTRFPGFKQLCSIYTTYIQYQTFNMFNIILSLIGISKKGNYIAFPWIPTSKDKFNNVIDKRYGQYVDNLTKKSQKKDSLIGDMTDDDVDQQDVDENVSLLGGGAVSPNNNNTSVSDVKRINSPLLPPYIVPIQNERVQYMFDSVLQYFIGERDELRLPGGQTPEANTAAVN